MKQLALALSVYSLSAAARPPISVADLKALVADKAWLEVLDKAQDVAPAERTAEWKAAIRDAAVASLLASPVANANSFAEAQRADALAARFQHLSTDPAFAAARSEAVARGIEACLGEAADASCWRLEAVYEKTLSGSGAARAARAFVKAGAVKYRPMVLFAAAMNSPDASVCTDPALAEAVLASLDLPSTHEAAKSAVKVGFEWCWAALAPQLKASLLGASDTRLSNVCKPLRLKKALTALQDAVCSDVEHPPE